MYRNYFNFSIKTYLIFLFMLPITGLFLFLLVWGMQKIEKQYEKFMQEDVELVARALRGPVGEAMADREFGRLTTTIEQVLDIKRLYGVYLYDLNGKLIYKKGGEAPKNIQDPYIKTLIKRDKQRGEYTELSKKRVYSYFIPLSGASIVNNIGLLQVVRKRSDIDNQLLELRLSVYIMMAVFIIFFFFSLITMYHYIVNRPVNKLINAFKKASKGDLKQTYKPLGAKEFRYLIQSFNEMQEKMLKNRLKAKEREEEKAKLKKQLQQSEKLAAIGELSAGIAHELGTPISVIDGRLQKAKRNAEGIKDINYFLNDLSEETEKMSKIVYDLLAFARPNSQGVKETINFNSFVGHTVEIVNELYNSYNIIKIKPPSYICYIDAEIYNLEQIIKNILVNSLHAVEKQKNQEILISWHNHNKNLLLIIEDNGPGIPTSLRSKVFEPFYTKKRPGKGTGLGLAVVYGIVQKYKGSIEIQTGSLGGAKFIITLPIIHEEDQHG